MRALKLGCVGPDVLSWKTFLRGLDPASSVNVDDKFDQQAVDATMSFQRYVGFHGVDVDGVVGNQTMAQAMSLGFKVVTDTDQDDPAPPAFAALSNAETASKFGAFAFVPEPTGQNPEAIRITDNWAQQNIVSVNIPQLRGVQGAPSSCNVSLHKLVAAQTQDLFTAWESAGLIDKVLTWNGSWVPRFVRGSRTVLSQHSWGTAFDINVQWNMLGTEGALRGEKGSVRELVQLSYDHGFFWGRWFQHPDGTGRPDPQHFQISVVK